MYEFDSVPMAKGGFGSIHAGRRIINGAIAPESPAEDVVLKFVNLHAAVQRKYGRLTPASVDEMRDYISR